MLDIVIACFNHQKYLQQCLQSIKEHISDLSKITVYICDDCSNYSNEYLNLIQKYNKYFNCQYFKTEKNSGPGIARNLGIENSNGDFITFIDDDDLVINDIILILKEFQDYDFVITEINDHMNCVIAEKNYINTLQGIVFSKKFLNYHNLTFPNNMTDGMEDSVFRTTCFFLASKYKIIDNFQFYYRQYRMNSCYTRNCFIEGIQDEQYKVLQMKDLLILISNIFQNLNKYNFYNKNNINIFIINLYTYIFDIIITSNFQEINSRFLEDILIILISEILKYYDINKKISIKDINNQKYLNEILELIDFSFSFFIYNQEENILILKKENLNILKKYLNNTFFLQQIVKSSHVFLQSFNNTFYFPITDLIYVYANNYYNTNFENEIKNE